MVTLSCGKNVENLSSNRNINFKATEDEGRIRCLPTRQCHHKSIDLPLVVVLVACKVVVVNRTIEPEVNIIARTPEEREREGENDE